MQKDEKFDLNFKNSFAVDEEFVLLLKNLCDEIDELDTDVLKTATLLSKIPYELAVCVISNLKYRKEEYVGFLNTFCYDEFNLDIKEKCDNKKSKFQNRLISQKDKNYEMYGIERLLTIAEIENLIKIFIEELKLNHSIEDVVCGKVQIEDKKLKILIKAHKYLNKKENFKTNQEIVKKLSKFWLNITLHDIKKQKAEKGASL